MWRGVRLFIEFLLVPKQKQVRNPKIAHPIHSAQPQTSLSFTISLRSPQPPNGPDYR